MDPKAGSWVAFLMAAEYSVELDVALNARLEPDFTGSKPCAAVGLIRSANKHRKKAQEHRQVYVGHVKDERL
jgi:hypothetical protein